MIFPFQKYQFMMIKHKSQVVKSTFSHLDYAIETIHLKTDDMIAQMIMTNSLLTHCNSQMYNLE